jgi:hypothetical protein
VAVGVLGLHHDIILGKRLAVESGCEIRILVYLEVLELEMFVLHSHLVEKLVDALIEGAAALEAGFGVHDGDGNVLVKPGEVVRGGLVQGVDTSVGEVGGGVDTVGDYADDNVQHYDCGDEKHRQHDCHRTVLEVALIEGVLARGRISVLYLSLLLSGLCSFLRLGFLCGRNVFSGRRSLPLLDVFII